MLPTEGDLMSKPNLSFESLTTCLPAFVYEQNYGKEFLLLKTNEFKDLQSTQLPKLMILQSHILTVNKFVPDMKILQKLGNLACIVHMGPSWS